MAIAEIPATLCLILGSGVLILTGFLAIRTHAGMLPVILHLQLMTMGLLIFHLFLKMTFKLIGESSSFIANIKVRGRSKYLEAVVRSLRPIKFKLVVRFVDNADLFLVILDQLIINYFITLLVTF